MQRILVSSQPIYYSSVKLDSLLDSCIGLPVWFLLTHCRLVGALVSVASDTLHNSHTPNYSDQPLGFMTYYLLCSQHCELALVHKLYELVNASIFLGDLQRLEDGQLVLTVKDVVVIHLWETRVLHEEVPLLPYAIGIQLRREGLEGWVVLVQEHQVGGVAVYCKGIQDQV